MTIKHLVLSGGGPSGIATCGFIHCLLESNYIDINEIQTIHATSAGTVNAVLLCLHKLSVDYDSIKNYIFKRPLHYTIIKAFIMSASQILFLNPFIIY